MAHSKDSWETAKAMFETGQSLSVIESATGISKGQLSKKSKKDNWQKETLKKLAKRELHTIIIQKEIEKEKETLNATQRKHYDKLILNEVQSQNLALNANHELLIKIHDDIKDGMKVEKINVGDGIQQFEPVAHGSSDHVNHAKAIQTVTDSLGITQRHSNQQINVNTQNNLQHNEINTEIVQNTLKNFDDEY